MGPSPGAKRGWLIQVLALTNQHTMQNSRIDMKYSRQGESDSLAAARLSNANHISSTQSHRPCLALNRCWRWEALRLDSRQKVVREAHLFEGRDWLWNIAPRHLHIVKIISITWNCDSTSTYNDLLFAPELLNLLITARRYTFIFNVEVLLEL